MSIFTDGPFVSSNDLVTLDGEVSDVAAAQNITISATIRRAIEERGKWLLGRLQRASGRDHVLQWHEQSYAPTYLESQNRPRLSLSQIVIDDPEYPAMWSALKNLCAYDSLYALYRNASRVAGDDRYQEKQSGYRDEIRNKFEERFVREGVPFIARPLACPGAVWEPRSGTWDSTAWAPSTGGSNGTALNYDVAITYVDNTQSLNNESGPSARMQVALPVDHLAGVAITALKPPTGGTRATQLARVTVNSLQATHWNVYIGSPGGTLYRQNDSPIPIAVTLWNAASNTLATDVEMPTGQFAERYITLPEVTFRG